MARTNTKPGWHHSLVLNIKKLLGMNIFLCAECKWNWRSACNNRERPNATWCRDFEKRG